MARGDVYYPLHCYSLSHLVPSLLTSGSDMSFIPHLADLANSQLRLIIYFIIGGSVTAITTYFASVGKGILSAFIVTLPLLTALTFILIDAEGGKDVVLNYARRASYFYTSVGLLCNRCDAWGAETWDLQSGRLGDCSLRHAILFNQVSVTSQKRQICAPAL